MANMLGKSRTWKWALCGCVYCRDHDNAYHRLMKRSARAREEKLWRSDVG